MIRRYIFPLFRSAYGILFVVAVLLSICIWFLGPSLYTENWDPFGTIIQRIVWIASIFGVSLLLMLLIWVLRRRRDRKMNEDIVSSTEDPDEDDAVKSEMDEMRKKLRTALVQLRKSKMGSRSLYELPWYVMIGPPGAGKTTAIVNSGLKFPLVEEFGSASIGGVGGTRNCDWWFTDNAVMIDTAGRYTTQESDAESDNQGWLNFLTLLKKHRKRQPINGAIIAISLSDLSMTDEVTQAAHARSIRRRLHELRDKLGVRFPIYVIFTKADLIAGFAEFFDSLGKEAREQVWGFTLPLEKAKSNNSPIAAFDDEFSSLLTQLNTQSLERMQQEMDHQRRSLIAGFPGQVASVRQVARDFLAEVFQDNKFEHRHMLRGVYFASGTQEGTPIDRLMMGMARTFGIGRQAIGSGRGTGRSYFLTRLFDQVIFKEAGLVSADDKVERRYRWTRRAAIAATILVAITAGTFWVRSFVGNRDLIAQTAQKLLDYQAAAAVVPQSPVGDTDLISTLQPLQVLRDLPMNPLAGEIPSSGTLGYGLFQGEVIGSNAAQAYRAGLNQHLLPRLLLRLEMQMQSSLNQPDTLYEALKVYLMLGQLGPLNAELVMEYMQTDWSNAYPGPGNENFRTLLTQHLEAMLSQPMQKVSLNGPLVEQAQTLLAQMQPAMRIYNGIVNSPRALELPKWRLTDVGGPAITRVMVRSSGKPMNEGIDGIYTYAGFNEVFLGEALGVARRIQSESWVLGDKAPQVQSEVALLAIARDVLDIYYTDYIARYEGLLGDLDIVPMQSIAQAVEVTGVLAGSTSPIFNVLNAVAEETRLTENRSIVPTAAINEGVSAVANLEIKSALNVQAQAFLNALQSAETTGGAAPRPPGAAVEERFRWLQELVVRPDGQASTLDDVMLNLAEVNREMSKISFSGVANVPTDPENSPLFRLNFAVSQIDQGPLKRWVSQVAVGSSGITADGTRAQMNAKWASSVLPVCTQTLDGRYPFNRRSREEVGIADFTRVFAPGGLIDAFFNENMAQFVDTQSRPWVWKKVNDADLGISDAVLVQFQNAAAIRAAFFPTGPQPQVQFQITPTALSPEAQTVKLEVDGKAVVFTPTEGQPPPTGVTWPGEAGYGRVTIDPPAPGIENAIKLDGPWGFFRLLDRAEVRNTNSGDKKRLIFNIGGRIAIFEMQTSSAISPFALKELADLSCPKTF